MNENILLLGETGVGKEVVARYLHELSGRGTFPFIAVNISAIPTELFESELMGSRRGAFTGAENRAGYIDAAERGTLFLDEIGDLPLTSQVRLLRFLQDRTVAPLGGGTGRVADVRVIAATNRELDRLIRSGDFRADLLHRFAPPLWIPPLRQRREEILPHAREWLQRKALAAGLAPPPRLTADAEELLQGHRWPGNVRQLQMVMASAALLCDGASVDRDLVASLLGPTGGPPDDGALGLRSWSDWQEYRDEQEGAWLRAVLEEHSDNAEAAAKYLGCPSSTFRYLLKKRGIRKGRDAKDGEPGR